MILTIRLDDVLHQAMGRPTWRDLVTRPTGAAVRGRIQAAIAAAGCGTARLDFTAVGLIDFSCADEVVAKLLRETAADGCFLVLTGLSPSMCDAIDQVLRRQQLAVAAWPDEPETAVILGWATPDVHAAFTAVQHLGPGDPDRLADALAWSVERAADALQGLALRGLVRAGSGEFRPLTIH